MNPLLTIAVVVVVFTGLEYLGAYLHRRWRDRRVWNEEMRSLISQAMASQDATIVPPDDPPPRTAASPRFFVWYHGGGNLGWQRFPVTNYADATVAVQAYRMNGFAAELTTLDRPPVTEPPQPITAQQPGGPN